MDDRLRELERQARANPADDVAWARWRSALARAIDGETLRIEEIRRVFARLVVLFKRRFQAQDMYDRGRPVVRQVQDVNERESRIVALVYRLDATEHVLRYRFLRLTRGIPLAKLRTIVRRRDKLRMSPDEASVFSGIEGWRTRRRVWRAEFPYLPRRHERAGSG